MSHCFIPMLLAYMHVMHFISSHNLTVTNTPFSLTEGLNKGFSYPAATCRVWGCLLKIFFNTVVSALAQAPREARIACAIANRALKRTFCYSRYWFCHCITACGYSSGPCANLVCANADTTVIERVDIDTPARFFT